MNDLIYKSILSFKGKFTADITVVAITGRAGSTILKNIVQNVDVNIDLKPSFILPGPDEIGTANTLYTTVLATLHDNNNGGVDYCLQAIAGYSLNDQAFYIQLPNPDVRIVYLGETRVCVAQITQLKYTSTSGDTQSITDIGNFLSIPESELESTTSYFTHSHTISNS